VGIFSLFGKKDRQTATTAEKDVSRAKRSSSGSGSAGSSSSGSRSGGTKSSRSTNVKRDAQAARATALKIDAIESEMSSEFVTVPTTTQPHTRTPKPAPASPAAADKPRAPASTREPEAPARQAASPELGDTTEMLLDGQTAVSALAELSSEAAAVVEEAAIMYANGQQVLTEQMLSAAIAEDNLGEAAARAWLMLFDLYQIAGKQQEFEQLAVAYANKFETSPPGWAGNRDQAPKEAASATPAVPFTGKLDAGCAKQIERIQKLASNYRTIRLEFARVTDVDGTGCGMLLEALNRLQKSGHDLILVGAAELADKIRATLEVGRRGDNEQAWLLLLEVLRLLNREHEFEEVSIDYCVTFEVSPPAFSAPQGQVTTAAGDAPPAETTEAYVMPKVIEGRVDELVVAIAAWADDHEPAIIDCAPLARVDFNAAGRMLTGLAPFCSAGKALEFREVNHLVAELFHVIGLHELVRIIPRKN
jgi:anti-anti-sigma regulatory factor